MEVLEWIWLHHRPDLGVDRAELTVRLRHQMDKLLIAHTHTRTHRHTHKRGRSLNSLLSFQLPTLGAEASHKHAVNIALIGHETLFVYLKSEDKKTHLSMDYLFLVLGAFMFYVVACLFIYFPSLNLS